MKNCENCGSKMYNGACTWCHEEIYIMDQYHEMGTMPSPNGEFMKRYIQALVESKENRKKIKSQKFINFVRRAKSNIPSKEATRYYKASPPRR